MLSRRNVKSSHKVFLAAPEIVEQKEPEEYAEDAEISGSAGPDMTGDGEGSCSDN